nr:MAG TPA: hypothetical protein [Caudoviricetes sp.]
MLPYVLAYSNTTIQQTFQLKIYVRENCNKRSYE